MSILRRARRCDRALVVLLAALVVGACGSDEPATSVSTAPGGGYGEAASAQRAEERPVRIVVLGDSLAAGLALEEAQAFPALVERQLLERGYDVEVVNAGVSGDTSAGGLRRIDWVLRQEPDLVVVELGANDGLRGLPVAETESNLERIIERAQRSGARVLLAGMRIPSNYGPRYTAEFAAVYPRLAERTGAALIPFLLDGVALDPRLNLPDRIHPNPAGHRKIADTVLPYVEPLVREIDKAR